MKKHHAYKVHLTDVVIGASADHRRLSEPLMR